MTEPMKDYAIGEAMILFADSDNNIQDVLAERMDTKYGENWLTASGQGDVKIHSKVQTNTTLIVEYKNNRIFLAKIKDSKQSKISKVMLKTMTNKIYLLLFIIITTQLYINSLKIILLI